MVNINPDLEPLIDTPHIVIGSARMTKRKVSAFLQKRQDRAKCGRMQVLCVLTVFVFAVIYLISLKPYQPMVVHIPDDDNNLPGPKVPSGYLVWNPQCKILSLDPLASDVMRLFTKENYAPCSTKLPLTSVVQNFSTGIVNILFHQHLIPQYLNHDQAYVECYYQEVIRSGINATADDRFTLSEWHYFDGTFELPAPIEFILIHCKGKKSKSDKIRSHLIYSNAHAIVRRQIQAQKTFDSFKTLYPTERPLSVLMLGIDSVSRLNLIRAMPNTAQHLYDTGWFELKGYNKIDDNTFPNLMAILLGYDKETSFAQCDPVSVGKLDACPFIWKMFEQSGYVTAYAEDQTNINTFNYNKKGFSQQPTNHYFRPFALAAEKNLNTKWKSGLKYCLGFQHYADYIFQYGIDFAKTYLKDPFFGLFWTNTFSHNDISDPSSMDLKIKYYLEMLEVGGILEESAVIFLSDHGIRFGPIRSLMTGWLEERLPFIFIWLPNWFKQKHPEIVQNLKINRNRLSNPYDLHMTLKHVIELSGRIDNLPPARSCANCQSLFNELPWNRSCAECAIETHWCTCTSYITIDIKSKVVTEAVKFIINSINTELEQMARSSNTNKTLCAHLHTKSIIVAKKTETITMSTNANESFTNFLLVFEVWPSSAKFEATVKCYHTDKGDRYELSQPISRLNVYSGQDKCVTSDYLKKLCYCL